MRLVLEVIEPTTESVIRAVNLDATLLDEIRSLLSILSLNVNEEHALTKKQLQSLNQRFDLSLKIHKGFIARLRSCHWTDNLPYKIHTTRELSMMLAGVKPLAAFSELYSESDRTLVPEKRFAPFVNAGDISKREYVDLSSHSRIRRVLYALKGEEWRLDAYILMLQAASKMGWNDGFERLEGYLLGYEEWQCDAYFAARKERQKS